jgi:small subunit ribosomal protein S1
LVSLNEFRDIPNLKLGDEVEVMVIEKEDREGHLNLSRRRHASLVHGKKLLRSTRQAKLITGTVTF